MHTKYHPPSEGTPIRVGDIFILFGAYTKDKQKVKHTYLPMIVKMGDIAEKITIEDEEDVFFPCELFGTNDKMYAYYAALQPLSNFQQNLLKEYDL